MPRGGGRGIGLSNLMSSKVMPIALFVIAIFFLPFLFTLVDRVPSIFLYSQGGSIGIGSSPPTGATAIDLKIIAVLILFLLPIFFVVAVVDRFARRV